MINKLSLKNVASVHQMSQFTVTKTAFDNLLGSDNLDIISNDALAESILLYYREIERLDKGIDNVLFVHTLDNITLYMLSNFDARNFEVAYKRLKKDPFFWK